MEFIGCEPKLLQYQTKWRKKHYHSFRNLEQFVKLCWYLESVLSLIFQQVNIKNQRKGMRNVQCLCPENDFACSLQEIDLGGEYLSFVSSFSISREKKKLIQAGYSHFMKQADSSSLVSTSPPIMISPRMIHVHKRKGVSSMFFPPMEGILCAFFFFPFLSLQKWITPSKSKC